MSSNTDGRQATMDSTQIYREDTFTDRKVGTIRKMTPVTLDGAVIVGGSSIVIETVCVVEVSPSAVSLSERDKVSEVAPAVAV